MTSVLSIRDVHRRYGAGANATTALAGVSLDVAAGEMVAIMGPSGSGKSTLLNLAGGLDRPTEGRVLVAGVDVARLDAAALGRLRRRSVGIVFQELNLLPTLTAVENVMLPLELDGTGSRSARVAGRRALGRVGLDHLADRYPDDLSGGEQQRVAVARAIVGARSLLLADEPTGALDTAAGDGVIELLADLAAEGTAVVVVTHEPRIASWAERVVWLRDGRVADVVSATDAPGAAS